MSQSMQDNTYDELKHGYSIIRHNALLYVDRIKDTKAKECMIDIVGVCEYYIDLTYHETQTKE